MKDDYQTWEQFCRANPKLAVAMLRIDRFSEPLKSAMISAIQAILDVLDATVITVDNAAARDAASE